MREIVVISGKGGTGKTSLVASFAALASGVVLADCDVDAADLHLLLAPEVRYREEFRCGNEAIIRQKDCRGCGICLARCRFGAVRSVGVDSISSFIAEASRTCKACDACVRSCPIKSADFIDAMKQAGYALDQNTFTIDPTACEGCGVCVSECPVKAIDFPERISGEWFLSDTRFGPMAHARLKPGGENSGKLVSKVREAAREEARAHHKSLVLVDGPPGTGCAVIASISGASQVLVVTEPTMCGAHDMKRVLELARHFSIPAKVCVNKWDLNPEMAVEIEAESKRVGATIAGRVRYDRAVTAAQLEGRTIVENCDGALVADIRAVWEKVST